MPLTPKEQSFWFEEKEFLFQEQFQQHRLDKLINYERLGILALVIDKIPYG